MRKAKLGPGNFDMLWFIDDKDEYRCKMRLLIHIDDPKPESRELNTLCRLLAEEADVFDTVVRKAQPRGYRYQLLVATRTRGASREEAEDRTEEVLCHFFGPAQMEARTSRTASVKTPAQRYVNDGARRWVGATP